MAPPEDNLPEGFNSWKHLKSQYSAEFNRQVKKYFSDHDVDWKPNINDKRSSLHTACLMRPEDSYTMMSLRMSFFFDLLRNNKKDLIVFHGNKETILPPVEGHPKVYLFFSQDNASVPASENRLESEFSFRLFNKTEENFTKADALELAREVKANFLPGGIPMRFDRGKLSCYMKDPKHGFDHKKQFLVRTQADATRLFSAIYKCIDKPFDVSKLMVLTPEKNSTKSEGTYTVYGETRKKPGYRPTATLQFRYAYIEIPGKPRPVFLIDTTYSKGAILDI